MHDVDVPEACGQLGLVAESSDHRETLRDADAVNLSSNEHAQAEVELQVLSVACCGVLLDAGVPSVLAPQAPRHGPEIRRDEVRDRWLVVRKKSAAAGDFNRCRIHHVADAPIGPRHLDHELVSIAEAAAKLEVDAEGARRPRCRQIVTLLRLALRRVRLRALGHGLKDVVVHSAEVRVRFGVGRRDGCQPKRRQGERVLRALDDVRHHPLELLRATGRHHDLRAGRQEDAGLQGKVGLGLHRHQCDDRTGVPWRGERQCRGHLQLALRPTAHETAARGARHGGRGGKVDERHGCRRDLRRAGVHRKRRGEALRGVEVAGPPCVGEAGGEVDDGGPGERGRLAADRAVEVHNVALAATLQMQGDLAGLRARLRLLRIWKRGRQRVLAEQHLWEREGQAPDLGAEPRRRVVLPQDRQLHGGDGLLILIGDQDIRRGRLALAIQDG
mmetsp:Transcript_18007/g.51133  ORF Transcript_18007/g.51133 Transcript_18007/m.51133 type:complete len:444 (-) Transcript_18007:1881-3212(-)